AWADSQEDRTGERDACSCTDQRVGHVTRAVHLIDKILSFALCDIEHGVSRAWIFGVFNAREIVEITALILEVDCEVRARADRCSAKRDGRPADGALCAAFGL